MCRGVAYEILIKDYEGAKASERLVRFNLDFVGYATSRGMK